MCLVYQPPAHCYEKMGEVELQDPENMHHITVCFYFLAGATLVFHQMEALDWDKGLPLDVLALIAKAGGVTEL